MVVAGEASWKVSRSPLATSTVPPRRSSAATAAARKVVRLVARCLGVGEAARRHEIRQCDELLDQRIVELVAALVGQLATISTQRCRNICAHEKPSAASPPCIS
jgi:hypothetical protein